MRIVAHDYRKDVIMNRHESNHVDLSDNHGIADRIRIIFTGHGHKDDWGVLSLYDSSLVAVIMNCGMCRNLLREALKIAENR